MMVCRNLKELSGKLKSLDVKNLKTKSGESYREILLNEANRLRDCIQRRLDEYIDSFQPKVYRRTLYLQRSLRVENILNIYVVGKTIWIDIYFDDSGYHRSGDGILGWDGTGETVNTAALLNYGYKVKKQVWFKNIQNFGYRSGGHFIENGIIDFLSNNPYNIRVVTNIDVNMEHLIY